MSGNLEIPTDEEILESDVQITPEEALDTALESYEGERQELENDGQLLTTPEGHVLAVWVRGEIVECLSHVADLSKASLRDANLLKQLLELNDEIVQPKFCIDSDGKLWIKSLRYKAGMDTAEAYSLIGNVLHTISKYCESIGKYLEDE